MWNIIEFSELASTNTLAAEKLASGEAKHGDVIQAHHQSSGRGRAAGRIWNDEPGASLLMSVVLTNIPEPAPLLQYRVALAVVAALRTLHRAESVSENKFRLKWPNDILWNGKKICGILLEAQWNASIMRSAIAGIGINVRQSSFPESLEGIATSLLASGIDVEVNDIRDTVLEELRLEMKGNRSVIVRLRSELAWMSEVPSLQWEGSDGASLSDLRYVDIDGSGALLLRLPDGSTIVRQHGSFLWSAQPS